MTFKKKLIILIPFILLLELLIFTWIKILSTDYFATIKHQIALSLYALTALFYFIKFRAGVLLTGLMLILATFNQLALLPELTSVSYFIRIGKNEIETPSIQGKALLLLLLYIVVTVIFWRDLFTKRAIKEARIGR